MVKSHDRGHETYYDGHQWRYVNNDSEIEHMDFDDAPKSWADKCSGGGYEKYTNENGERVYKDCNIPAGELGYRPCAKCGKYPNERGDDACIASLGKVVNACCGHGRHEGYIQFDSGITIRGYFRVEQAE